MTRRRASSDLAERLLGGPVVWIGLVLLTAFALGPFIWMLLTSLKNRQELYATPVTTRETAEPGRIAANWVANECARASLSSPSAVLVHAGTIDSARVNVGSAPTQMSTPRRVSISSCISSVASRSSVIR